MKGVLWLQSSLTAFDTWRKRCGTRPVAIDLADAVLGSIVGWLRPSAALLVELHTVTA